MRLTYQQWSWFMYDLLTGEHTHYYDMHPECDIRHLNRSNKQAYFDHFILDWLLPFPRRTCNAQACRLRPGSASGTSAQLPHGTKNDSREELLSQPSDRRGLWDDPEADFFSIVFDSKWFVNCYSVQSLLRIWLSLRWKNQWKVKIYLLH